ncbi:LysR family transcriptional regulator [Novosphingobium sp.]|uniref:LysR family transcriptional regulator n=1 Tax=Novosphingobium sp. TaxID=1874826 RepID=UPI0026373C85|nr:LysR family transcriptional regulator [Novosphingobium sp.]
MRVVDLSLLLEVARSGSFAEVARLRGTDPSSIGRIVAGIEEELGVRLFERTTRRMTLTEAGDRYLAHVGPALVELERAQDEARSIVSDPQGTLRLTASVTFGQRMIVPLLGAFRQRYPAITVECIFTDANIDLIADRIDLAIRLAPVVTGDMIVTKLCDTRYRVVATPDYLASAPPLQRPTDLVQHRVVLFPLAPFRSRWIFRDQAGAMIEQPVDGDIVVSPAGAVLDAVLADLGPALLPDWLIDDHLRAGRLRDSLPDWDVAATSFDTAAWLLYPSRSYLPGKTRAIIDFLKSSIAR